MLKQISSWVLILLFVATSVLLAISNVNSYAHQSIGQDLSGSNQILQQMADFVSILTQEEQNYLKTKKIITMCNNPKWAPIVFASGGNQDDMQGIAIDTLREIEKRIDVKFKNIPTENWKEGQQYLKDKKVDILPCYIKNPAREMYANFTRPYLCSVGPGNTDYPASYAHYPLHRI
jgi:ABC-type amino acid transport substrate-binding protein